VRRLACALLVAAAACTSSPSAGGDPQAAITALLHRSAADWNRGDLAGFMGDYAHDTLTSYLSGGRFTRGWQPLFDHYQAAYFAPGKHRDSLTFDDVRVRALAPQVALATAHFYLHRGDSLTASGPFTLILMKDGDRWHIVHDHTSSDPKP
jgi:ketosteroid isomerase-like protein